MRMVATGHCSLVLGDVLQLYPCGGRGAATRVQRERVLLVLASLPYKLVGFLDYEHPTVFEIYSAVHLFVTAAARDGRNPACVKGGHDLVDAPVDALYFPPER